MSLLFSVNGLIPFLSVGQSKIPVRKNSGSGKHGVTVQRSNSNTSEKKSKLPQPITSGYPASARSIPDSARTAASDVSLHDDTWTDNEDSLFASARTPKDKKPSLLQLQVGNFRFHDL